LKVIPGITSLQTLTASHAIPLNEIGEAVTITTGRKLRDEGWPKHATDVTVMLDGDTSFQYLKNPETYHIWWGAYVGMAEQTLLEGRLDRISQTIQQTRDDLRRQNGWIMDIYKLRLLPPQS